MTPAFMQPVNQRLQLRADAIEIYRRSDDESICFSQFLIDQRHIVILDTGMVFIGKTAVAPCTWVDTIISHGNNFNFIM